MVMNSHIDSASSGEIQIALDDICSLLHEQTLYDGIAKRLTELLNTYRVSV